MSVLVRGMEMPKKPGAYSMKIRLFVREDGTASIWGLEEYIPHEPLDVIHVPEHGDLIERRAVCLTDFEIAMCGGDYKEGMKMLLEKVESAPTIIPAEEEGE